MMSLNHFYGCLILFLLESPLKESAFFPSTEDFNLHGHLLWYVKRRLSFFPQTF